MNLEYAFNLIGTLRSPIDFGAGPFGTRRLYEVTGGAIEGKGLRGKVLTGGGDWLLVGPDGFARLDVRVQLLTDDGAWIYVYYTGLLELNKYVVGVDATTDYGDQYFRTTPRFETGDPRYAWLNQTLFVAEGRIAPGSVEYRIYRIM